MVDHHAARVAGQDRRRGGAARSARHVPACCPPSMIIMDAGQIIEDNEPEEFFINLQNERTQLFLSQILQH